MSSCAFLQDKLLSTLIYKNLSKLGKISLLPSPQNMQKIPIKEGEIYLLFVGVVVVPELTAIVDEVEKEFEREINYTRDDRGRVCIPQKITILYLNF